jgi:hypothetical protein
MSQELLGDDLKLYWDDDADFASPDWKEQVSVGDMGRDPNNEQVEIPLRLPFKFYKKGRGDWSLTFTANIDTTNLFHLALLDAIDNGTPIHLAIALGEITDGGYWHAWFMLGGPTDGSLDTNANIEVEGKLHHYRGPADADLPAFVALAS